LFTRHVTPHLFRHRLTMLLSAARRACFAALVALAFTGCDDPTSPLPREGAPDELRFSWGGFGMGGTTVQLEGDAVVTWTMPWGWMPGTPIDSVRTVPTAAAWAAFWEAAERAGVSRWRERYLAEGVVDGTGYSLRIVADGRVLESAGSNAYPDRFGREHEMDMPESFSEFMDALGVLAGRDL
jgi:hypothetical protein